MKRFAYFAAAALSSVLLLASCGETSTPITSDQSIANGVVGSGGIAVTSLGANLRAGTDESNSMKSSAYLYLSTSFLWKNAEIDGVKQDVTATLVWTVSDLADWDITSPFDASHDKYVPTYPSKGSANISCTLTATAAYGAASAETIYNITLVARS